MNVSSILLKKVILEEDSETWSRIRKHYLPAEYHQVFSVITDYYEDYNSLPSFEALKLSVRSNIILDKIYAIEASESVEIDNDQLLEFLKNEYTQEEIMAQIQKWLDESIMIDTAKENVERLQDMIVHIEDRVDLKDPEQDMQTIELFDSEEELGQALALGLNSDFDAQMKFFPGEYILFGGIRGTGKSLTCSNIAEAIRNSGRSVIYFTIEMTSRAILQRNCAISTGVAARHMRMRNLSQGEWVSVAKWWADRYIDGQVAFNNYMKHHDFDKFHAEVKRQPLNPATQLEVVYDPELTITSMRSELDRKVPKLNPAAVIVDYVKQVRRTNNRNGQYDWTEQIEVSKNMKSMAQYYGVPFISPFQMDSEGKARFSKGILDSCDAAFNLHAYKGDESCVHFECVKMRDNDEIDFTSKADWDCLRFGPESAVLPKKKKTSDDGEEAHDM